MAYIVSTLQTAAASGAATYTVNFPTGSGAPVSGDTIVVLLTQDGSTESLAVGTSGFTALGTQVEAGGNAGTSCLPFFKISTGGETSASFACSTASIIGTAIVIRDAHATAPFGSVVDGTDYKRVEWNVANYADSPNGGSALTTAVDECLLLYMFCCDGTGYMRCKLSEVVQVDKFIGTASGHIIGCNQQQTAGVAPTVRMLHNTAAEGGNAWVIAVRNKSGGALQPMPRATATDIKYYGSWATQHDSVTWQAPSSFSVVTAGAFTIGNKYTIVSVGTTDFTLIGASANTVGVFFTATGAGTGTGTAGEAINAIYTSGATPTIDNTNFWTATGATHGAQTRISTTVAAEAFGGATHTITSTDMTGKVFSFEWARTAVSSASINGTAGQLVGFSDGTNWAVYQVASKAKSWAAASPERAFVALDTATPYATGGTWDATAKAAITRIGYFAHISGSGTAAMEIKNAMLFDDVALTGGGSSRPAKFLDYQSYINSWGIYRAGLIQGSSQILCYQGLQIGDGTNATYFDGAAQSIEYPQTWSATANSNWQMNWNAGDNSVGLTVYAKAGDTINLASGVAATDSAQNLSIHASTAAAGDATYSFAQSFVGWRAPIDNKGLAWNGAAFKECGTVTIAGGGDLTNCTIAKTTSTHAPLTITANGTTVTTSTITVADTSITTAHHISLGASVTAVTLNGVTLSGTAGTDKIYSALASGTLTITLDGTGTTLVAGDVTFIGGSTAVAVIAAPQPTLDAVVLANTRAVLWNRTTAAELDNTFVAGTSWSKIITSGASTNDVLDLYAFKEGYAEARATLIYSGADASFAVDQVVDTAIDYYRTQESITDYTTLTEYNFYAPDIYIQADDADGENKLKRLFIFYNGVLTTEDGARYMRGGVTFNSPFDVVINRSVQAIAVDNVSATYGLHFTDEDTIRVTTDDGTSWIAPPSAPGSIRYAFGVSPGQIETGVSGVTAQDITDIADAAATAVVGNSKTLTVPKFLGLK